MAIPLLQHADSPLHDKRFGTRLGDAPVIETAAPKAEAFGPNRDLAQELCGAPPEEEARTRVQAAFCSMLLSDT